MSESGAATLPSVEARWIEMEPNAGIAPVRVDGSHLAKAAIGQFPLLATVSFKASCRAGLSSRATANL